jgi:hypothetical protein
MDSTPASPLLTRRRLLVSGAAAGAALLLPIATARADWSHWRYFDSHDGVRCETRFYTNGAGVLKQCQWRCTNNNTFRVNATVRDTTYFFGDGTRHEALVSMGATVGPGETRRDVSDSLPAKRHCTRIEARMLVKEV